MRDDLLELSQLLQPHHDRVRTLVRLLHQSRQFGIDCAARGLDVRLGPVQHLGAQCKDRRADTRFEGPGAHRLDVPTHRAPVRHGGGGFCGENRQVERCGRPVCCDAGPLIGQLLGTPRLFAERRQRSPAS